MAVNEREILRNPIKTYQKLAIPLIAYALFDALYLLIDTFWASFVGIEGVIAVGVSTPIFTLIIKFGTCLGQGTNSFMSRSLGGDNIKQAENTLLHGILIGLIIAIVIPLTTIPFLKEILGIFNYNGGLKHIIYYLVPLLICAFVFILNGLLCETIQSEGDSKRPTTYMIIGSIINLFLSPILAFELELGIMGLSLGTVFGSLFPLIMFIYSYIKQININTKISFKEFKFKLKIIKEIMNVTLPNFIDRSLFSFLAVYINFILTLFVGAEYIAVYTFCMKIGELIQAPARGSARGLLTITGHLYGAKRINKIRKIYRFGLILGIVLSIVTSIILIYFQDLIFPKLFRILLEISDLNILCLGLIIINLLMPFSFVVGKILDGLGKSIYSLVGTIVKIILTILFISIFAFIAKYQGFSVLIGIIIAELIVACLYIILIEVIFKRIEKNPIDTC